MTVKLLFLAFIPALGWGLMPILSKIFGGSSEEQLLGTTITALVCGFLFSSLHQLTYDMPSFSISFLSGIFWSVGQYFQFRSLEKGKVSIVMPFSVASQLTFVTLASGLFLMEWSNLITASLSILALMVILLGVFMVTKTRNGNENISKQLILFLFISSISLMCYVTINAYFGIDGSRIFKPQSMGMFFGSLLISYKKFKQLRPKPIIKNFATGSSWVIANTTLLLISSSIGVGTAFSFSQMSLLVTTYGSFLLLKEKKSTWEKRNISIGTLIYILGVVGMSLLK
ncbi:multidrug DMT transporter permease [Enterococcus hirae]|nr:multidrug DMT transporter permease [Enterococcus hirae]